MEPTVVTLPLFDEEPSRPVADRLRPTKLEDVVGQDHLLAADAAAGPAWSPSSASAPPSCGAARRREDHHHPAPRRRQRHGLRAGVGHDTAVIEPPAVFDIDAASAVRALTIRLQDDFVTTIVFDLASVTAVDNTALAYRVIAIIPERLPGWICPACGQYIRDSGPRMPPADAEAGHADKCTRLAAATATWQAAR
jgi:hypothetical protein